MEASPVPLAVESEAAGPAQARYRVLFIHPGPVPPSRDPSKNAQTHLSRVAEGDLVSTRWPLPEERMRPPRPVTFDTLGAFGYHATLSVSLPGPIKTLWNFAYFATKGLWLSLTGGRYDAVIAYGPFTTGIASVLVARLTGAKLIIEVPGHPFAGFALQSGAYARFKARVARFLVPLVIRRADALILRYPGQLDDLPGGNFPPASAFPNLVPISHIPPSARDDGYLLFLGYPWYLKGVDLLIKAFNAVCDRFPDVSLRVVGHCADRSPFEALADGNPRISFHPGMPHEDAMALMAGCKAFVLPSRTEAMARVLLEAMASRKPIVASRLGGIPTYIEDGHNGLLFEPGNADDLADKLAWLLTDPDLARALAEEGYRRVHRDLSESQYVERVRELLERVVGPPPARRRHTPPLVTEGLASEP
jgi:glycosyltransferase involved in cell wall biosynthesis